MNLQIQQYNNALNTQTEGPLVTSLTCFNPDIVEVFSLQYKQIKN